MSRPIKHLRWYIGGLLFLSTVINYIDRQTLSVLGPYLKIEYQWTNTDFAMVLIAFRVAYTIGQTIAGRVIDRLGTRKGLAFGVAWYSVAAMMTSMASGLTSFMGARFLLGLGEAGNWPGATKAVSEWFPRRESGWAVALFDSGSSVGAAIAPWLVLSIYAAFGSWRPAFIITGGQDNVQGVAGQMLAFFSELGFTFPQFPFVAHSRGWTAEDMESNVRFVQTDSGLREGARELPYGAFDWRLPAHYGGASADGRPLNVFEDVSAWAEASEGVYHADGATRVRTRTDVELLEIHP